MATNSAQNNSATSTQRGSGRHRADETPIPAIRPLPEAPGGTKLGNRLAAFKNGLVGEY